MTQKIPCLCDDSFTVEIPQEIDLDAEPVRLDEILDGTFLNFTCPSCGKKHKPEFAISISWPSKKVSFEVLVELDRGEFYRRKKDKEKTGPLRKETIIGYPELADRLLVYRDNLEPAAIEAIKYYLHLKAEENYPDQEITIWYSCRNNPKGANPKGAEAPTESLEFHIHGIKQDEVAVMKVPYSLYEKTLEDYKKHPKNEIFTALKHRTYLSVKNMMRPEALK
jgi:hypothetical protein